MNNNTAGEFVKQKDGKLIWVETTHYELIDTGCVYLAFDPAKPENEKHMVYKLQVQVNKKIVWFGLWNSCVHSGVKIGPGKGFKSEFDSIQEAIEAKQADGWIVRRLNFSDFVKTIHITGKYN